MSKYWLQRSIDSKMPVGEPQRCEFKPTIHAQNCEWVRVFTREELDDLEVLEAKINGLIEAQRPLLNKWSELKRSS